MVSHKQFLQREIERFTEQIKYLIPSPSEIPKLNGIDIYGTTRYLNEVAGGDHIIFINFNKRYDLEARIKNAKTKKIRKKLELNKTRAGILIADAAGHGITDGLVVAQLHQAFLIGALYELEQYGEITSKLFEIINTRFYNSSSTSDFITMLYGEISERGIIRFFSAAHPLPLVFCSDHDHLVPPGEHNISVSQPIGFIPSKHTIDKKKNYNSVGFKDKYEINELKLPCESGIFILYTDGLSEHFEDSFEEEIEIILKKSKKFSSKTIFNRIEKRIYDLKDPEDDISYVVVKK